MDASFHIRPFGFDEVFTPQPAAGSRFDDIDPWLRIEALLADLAVARQDAEHAIAAARAEGFIAGLAQAREEQAAAVLAATDAIHGAVEAVEAALEETAERTVRDAAAVALAAGEILAGRALAHAPHAAIEDAIGRALRQVARGQEIQVSVHPDLVDAIEAVITRRQSGDRRRLTLSAIGDAAIAFGDAHIHWDQGGIVLDATARRDAIAAALAGVLPVE